MTAWMFQCNPQRYSLLAAAETGSVDQWSMKQHRETVAVGDRVYFFISGPAAGIYVVAQVVSPVYEVAEPDEFGRYKVDVEYESLVEPYLPRHVLTDTATEPILASHVPFKGQQQTNFILPPEVAERLDALTAPRLRVIDKKPWQRPDVSLYAVDTAIKAHEKQVRARLLAALKDRDPFDLQAVVGRLFERIRYNDWAVGKRGGDMGIDVTATLRVGGVTEVPTVIQVSASIPQRGRCGSARTPWRTHVRPTRGHRDDQRVHEGCRQRGHGGGQDSDSTGRWRSACGPDGAQPLWRLRTRCAGDHPQPR